MRESVEVEFDINIPNKITKTEEIIKLYKKGYSINNIKKILHISYDIIDDVLNSNNIIKRVYYLDKEFKEKVKKLYSDGKTYREIACLCGVSVPKIHAIIGYYGYSNRNIDPLSSSYRRNKITELYKNGYKLKDIGVLCGIHKDHVSTIIYNLNIQNRLKRKNYYDDAVINLRSKKMSYREIQKTLKISPSAINRICVKNKMNSPVKRKKYKEKS